MSIYFGNDTVNDLYVGLTLVSKGYVGTHLFYDGDNTIIDTTYEKYILNTQFSTLYNTAEKPVKSAILKGNTKYRDIDTGDILDTFDKTKNLELVSVKMPVLKTTGKNLLNEATMQRGYITSTGSIVYDDANAIYDYVRISPNTKYYGYNFGYVKSMQVSWYDVNKTFLNRVTCSNDSSVISPSDAYYARVHGQFFEYTGAESNNDFSTVQIILSTEPITAYEPFKTNILTTSEEVELRGIGDIKDELDLLTGELTQRIDEIVLDGSENWTLARNNSITSVFGLLITLNSPRGKNVICDKMDGTFYSNFTDGKEAIKYATSLYVNILNSKATTVDEFKIYLKSNPITVQYQLATESIKTVDLSVVDQDGNDTELSTFDDLTHVTLSSEGLIPEAELEVATKNEEVLNTMSLEMDDISATQTTLEETSNTQSENVDATMLATTEIYEQLL